MKKVYVVLCAGLAALCWGCSKGNQTNLPDISHPKGSAVCVESGDSVLTQIFGWAQKNSSKYVGSDTDRVGPWYEAALPNREAFCMRDVSHQCIGDEINGHGRQNANMMGRFVENIAASRDYCSYWEINRWNEPAPADYVSDKDFWYNLNANFDVMNACYRLYMWTGDKRYIEDERFVHFFDLTVNDYMKRWKLNADEIMQRKGVMNTVRDWKKTKFKAARGLPSYDESVEGLTVSGDLVAAVYGGLKAYGEIKAAKGDRQASDAFVKKAQEYADLYNTQWWNEKTQDYYAYKLKDKQLHDGRGGGAFPIWFGIVKDMKRADLLLNRLAGKETNAESMSYYPMLYYRYGFGHKAYGFLKKLYKNKRRDYPEVSAGVIEGVVCGLAGVEANAVANRIETLARLDKPTQWVAVENIPVFSGKCSVLHASATKSSFFNNGNHPIVWRAAFSGKIPSVKVGKVLMTATHAQDAGGHWYSYVDIACKSGETLTAMACQ